MGLLDLLLGRFERPSQLGRQKAKCPVCKAELRLDMKKCPRCGRLLSEMFMLVCPECRENMPFGTKECPKCGFNLEAPPKRVYTCPICGYEASYWMLECPSCGVKFSS